MPASCSLKLRAVSEFGDRDTGQGAGPGVTWRCDVTLRQTDTPPNNDGRICVLKVAKIEPDKREVQAIEHNIPRHGWNTGSIGRHPSKNIQECRGQEGQVTVKTGESLPVHRCVERLTCPPF
ncbi:hypothetical protein Bbelb_297080 [Branchiostoma belcheri]|nr:hypothetical protein Bbelb_297080 [Branchiostoma belcheri]